MTDHDRRSFLGLSALGGGGLALAATRSRPAAGFDLGLEPRVARVAGVLQEAIEEIPVDDTHCHPLTFGDAQTTPDDFIERIALSAFPLPGYFPPGVYASWRGGDAATRARLDREHDISTTRRVVLDQARETVFVRFMTKELAAFLGSEATLEAVIEARNARGRDYAAYLAAMFADARIENAMLDMGYREGMDAAGVERFERAISPTAPRRLLRVDTILGELMPEDPTFGELESVFVRRIEEGLDGDGNLGAPSYGMKSYLLPRLGLLKPAYDRGLARESWGRVRAAAGDLPSADGPDRDAYWDAQSEVLRYFHSLALEACLERGMPMQFHAGDGEAPRGIMRRQDPFLMEEMVRFERDGVMRMPKVILIHAGYPLVGKAAWLTHLYPNCHFELSLATPLIHHGLLRMYLEVMEVVPLTKILFGSDAYHLPELYWLAAKWGRRFLSQALAVYVDAGILDAPEALEAARLILHGNNRRLYGLT